jgi:hypothetical protein
MKILSREEMEKLNTKRLLAYKNRLLRVSDGDCWCGDSGCNHERDALLEDGVFIKASPLWQETYKNVKEVLNTREHIQR